MQVNLTEIKRERKHLEQDAQLLANRIKLLQLEDEKTWKKIQETKRKAKQLSLVKQQQEEKSIMKNEIKQERERALSEKRSNYQRIREIQKKERDELRSALFHSKREEAVMIKNQRESNIRNKKVHHEIISEENKIRKNAVKKEKEIGKVRILEFQQRKNQMGREMYWQKVEENEKVKQEKMREVQEMEKLEMELIKKLENTQTLHAHANQQLENMMRSPGMSLIYSSMLHKNKYDSL